MKLAFYTLLKNSSWGGSENLWHKTALLALREKHDVLLIINVNLRGSNQVAELKNLGAEIYIIQDILTKVHHKLINKIFSGFNSRFFSGNLLRKINQFKPDLLLINQPGGYDILYQGNNVDYLLNNKGLKYGILTHSYSIYDILTSAQRIQLKEKFDFAKQLFFVAKQQADYINGYTGITNSHQAIVSNPLNISEIKLIKYPFDHEKKIKMAMVTTLFSASKGIDKLITILSKPFFKEKTWELEIYGNGPEKEFIQNLINENSIGNKIKLMGYADNIEEVWKNNEILLMPSRVDAAPSVLLEAMACGRTSVCTNVGFCNEWIENEVNGFISLSVNPNDFEIMLKTAFNQRDKWKDMGISCHYLVKNKHPKKPEVLFLNKLKIIARS